MGLFDNIFGGIFDFNHDGETTWDEEWLGFKIFEEVDKEMTQKDSSYHSFFDDDNSDDSVL